MVGDEGRHEWREQGQLSEGGDENGQAGGHARRGAGLVCDDQGRCGRWSGQGHADAVGSA